MDEKDILSSIPKQRHIRRERERDRERDRSRSPIEIGNHLPPPPIESHELYESRERIQLQDEYDEAQHHKNENKYIKSPFQDPGWVRFETVDPNKRFTLRGYRPNERMNVIIKCDNVSEKIDLLIDWVRYAFPPQHEYYLFNVIIDVFLHLFTMAFDQLPQCNYDEYESIIKYNKFIIKNNNIFIERHETERIRSSLTTAFAKFRTVKHSKFVYLFTNIHHEYLPDLLTGRNPIDNFYLLSLFIHNRFTFYNRFTFCNRITFTIVLHFAIVLHSQSFYICNRITFAIVLYLQSFYIVIYNRFTF